MEIIGLKNGTKMEKIDFKEPLTFNIDMMERLLLRNSKSNESNPMYVCFRSYYHGNTEGSTLMMQPLLF